MIRESRVLPWDSSTKRVGRGERTRYERYRTVRYEEEPDETRGYGNRVSIMAESLRNEKKISDLVSKYNYLKINEWINKSWTTEGGKWKKVT